MEEENKKEDLQEQTIEQDDSFIEENTANLVEDSLDANNLPLKENIVEQVADDEIFIEEAQQNNVDFEHVVSPKVPKTSKKADLDLVTVSPVEFVSFDEDKENYSDDPKANLDIMQDVKMHVTVELGRAKSSVKKILDLTKGSIVELNKVAGEQVELYVNGKFVAWGEVIVIEDKFGLRVTNVSNQNLHNL